MAELANYVIALVTVGLLLTATLLALRWWMAQGSGIGLFKDRAAKRVAVVDQIVVDTRRRLLLIRRDDVEHLVMIGGPSDVVIETAIQPSAARLIGATDQTAPAPATLSGLMKRSGKP